MSCAGSMIAIRLQSRIRMARRHVLAGRGLSAQGKSRHIGVRACAARARKPSTEFTIRRAVSDPLRRRATEVELCRSTNKSISRHVRSTRGCYGKRARAVRPNVLRWPGAAKLPLADPASRRLPLYDLRFTRRPPTCIALLILVCGTATAFVLE